MVRRSGLSYLQALKVGRLSPVEHERTGYLRGNSFVSPTTVNRGQFRQGLALNQAGATPIYWKNKTYFKVGKIVLTRGQVLEGRWRAGEFATGRNISKKVVGL